MPRRRGLRQTLGILPHAELIIMILVGMMRNLTNWFSFTWNGNVQEVWNLPGPEPSFTAKYHFDYWLKNVLSLVVLFRNFTTHLHLLFYIAMLYPVLTGERPRLMLPWLYLQMAKNIVTDVICTVAGVLLCWVLHSCGLLTLEFLVVRILSMMPSIYLWRRLRSYYFELYYAELDGEYSSPVVKANQGLTLAQRRRATKSLEGTIPTIGSAAHRSRFNSCVTYDEFFGPANWEVDADNKASKSLTTLLTIESQDSDDVEEDTSLLIIDAENLTPAEKTLKILGLTREEVDAAVLQTQKITSTTDLGKSDTLASEPCTDQDMKSSCVSVTGDSVEPRSVGIQVRLPDLSNPTASEMVSNLSGEKGAHSPKKCECCEKIKCSKEDDSDSDEEEHEAMGLSTEKILNAEDRSVNNKPLDCCDRNRKENGKPSETRSGSREADDDNIGMNPKTVSTTSTYHKNDFCPSPGLQVVIKKDGIAWDNLREINFVSVINKALCNEMKPFRLQENSQDPAKSIRETFKNLFEGSREELTHQSDQNIKEIIPEHEDGTKFIHRLQEEPNLELAAFSGPTSASFGVESGILATNTSYVFEKIPNSDAQSFDSTVMSAQQLIRPDHEAEFNSYFKSSFQRHSDMFDDTRARLEPLPPLQGRVQSFSYRNVHRVDEDSRSCQPDGNSLEKKNEDSYYSLDLYRSWCNGPQHQPDNCGGWDSNQGNFTGNEIDAVQDVPEILTSKDLQLENQQVTSDPEIQIAQEVLSSNELTQASQTSTVKIKKQDNSATAFIPEKESITEAESHHSKSSRQKSSKDRRSLASSSKISRLSKNGETPEEREAKEMQALRAYNEKTLFKYKREMETRNRGGRAQDEFADPLVKKNPVGNHRHSSGQAFYVPSVPELEKPGHELIWNIEKAYARFSRSKPVDPVTSQALHGNCAAEEFFDIYNGNGSLKKDSRKIRISDKTAMRKQHSKYSKLGWGANESDVTSKSCKLIEGSQKGRELDRCLAMENIRAQNVEVYFLERQIDEEPSTSKNVPITTIKSFSRENDPDLLSTVSSEILGNSDTRSPMIEVLNNSEEIPCRIEDSEYYRQLRKNTLPKSVKEVVDNIDWSFPRPAFDESTHQREIMASDTSTGIGRVGTSSERQDIVGKTTENILRRIFAESENSDRGFHLGESANEFYPIFNTVAVAMGEIIRAAALRGYSDEFISQPAREIEVPEIGDGNLYGLSNLSCELRRGSSSGFVRCSIFPEDNRADKKRCENQVSPLIATSMAPDIQDKKLEALRRETDSLDQDESTSPADEESSSLLCKLISSPEPRSAEVNVPVIGAEDLPEEPEDTSGDLASPAIKDLEDYSSILFKTSSKQKKSSTSSRCRGPENSLQIGQRTKGIISSERVRLALHNITLQLPGQEVPDKVQPKIESDLASHRGILDRFDAGGQELQSIVLKFFDQFPNSESFSRNRDSAVEGFPMNLKGSELIPHLQVLTNLCAIEIQAGAIMDASEEAPSGSTENSSSERATTQTDTSDITSSEAVTTDTSTRARDFWRNDDRDREENNLKRRVVVGMDNRPDSGAFSPEEFDKPSDDDKKLLSNISESESVPIAPSELLKRADFRREVISSGFVQAIKQSTGLSNSAEGTQAEISGPKCKDGKVENGSLTPNAEKLSENQSRHLFEAQPEAEMLELWITDDEEQMISSNTLIWPMVKSFPIDPDNATSDVLLRDIETAENAIKRVKTTFEEFLAESQKRKTQAEKSETLPETKSKVSSLTNLIHPSDGDLRKLRNLVQTVVNYVTIAKSSSTQSIKSFTAPVASHIQRKEPNAEYKTETSDNLGEVAEALTKNESKSIADDPQAAGVPVPKSRSSLKNSEGRVRLRDEIGPFSSWDRVIPSSTKRQIAKSNRKSRPKKAAAVLEPRRRVVKVVKLTEEKSVDFFGARSVPQRGRGLSSGYLMDSDSDGNLTVSRPPTPVSLESETSSTSSACNGQPCASTKALEASESFSMPDSTFPANQIKDTFLLTEQANPTDNFAKKIDHDSEELRIQEFRKISYPLLVIEAEAPVMGESVQPGIISGDQSTQDALYDKEMHVLGAESLSTAGDLRYRTSLDAAGVEDELKSAVQQILSHQFREVNPLINGFRNRSKNASLTSIPDCIRTESPVGFQLNSCSPEDDVEEEEKLIRQDCHKKIQELLYKSDDTSVQQLDVHYRGSDLTSRNSDEVSIEVTPRKSGVSTRSVAIGTEYNEKVFKDLLDVLEKFHSIGEKPMIGQASKSYGVGGGNDAQDDRPINYGNGGEIGESNFPLGNQVLPVSKRNTSGMMSSQTPSLENIAEEDRPAFLDGRIQGTNHSPDSSEEMPLNRTSNSSQPNLPSGVILTMKSSADDETSKNDCNLVIGSRESVHKKIEESEMVTTSYDSFNSTFSQNTPAASEISCQVISISNHTYFEDFPEQVDSSIQCSTEPRDVASKLSLENLDEKNNQAAAADPSSSKSNDESQRIVTSKKKGIPRPVKGSK